ncbi:hypothetical protein [Alkalilimnicola ehrlichii]|uniref:hypothetical protein n=1 Tax=Alkalilimnicola ehrlichii TaxID=351052 RepID=UPI0015F29E73|nr:hypothetical protein [Alkalilimnicola ehrlichii]
MLKKADTPERQVITQPEDKQRRKNETTAIAKNNSRNTATGRIKARIAVTRAITRATAA